MRNEMDKIRLGDSYQLIKEVPDKSVDCIYTDIPYLYKMGGGGGGSPLDKRIVKMRKSLAKIRDGIDYSIFDEFVRVMKKVNCFIWCSKAQVPDILNYFVDMGCNFDILVWCKTNPTPATNNVWLPDVEYCLYFREQGVPLNDGMENKSKWYLAPINKRDKDEFGHPTIKPLDLVKSHLLHATQPGDLVFDPFLGSGTTCVASKETGRDYLGFEIDPLYYTMAIDRLNGINTSGQTSIFTNFESIALDLEREE